MRLTTPKNIRFPRLLLKNELHETSEETGLNLRKHSLGNITTCYEV